MNSHNAPHNPEVAAREAVLTLSSPAHFDGMFWASPEILQKWADRINSVELSTMSIGAISHEDELGNLSEQLLQLIRPSTHLHEDVLKAGLMYGGAVAADSIAGEQCQTQPVQFLRTVEEVIVDNALFGTGFLKSWYGLSNIVFERQGLQAPQAEEKIDDVEGEKPQKYGTLVTKHNGEVIEAIKFPIGDKTEKIDQDDQPEDDDNDAEEFDLPEVSMAAINVAFMQIRQLEVELFGSDILASTFGVVQDHMANQAFRNTQSAEPHIRANIASDAQLLFYVGALCGAIKKYLDEGSLPKPPTTIELHRGINDAETVYSAVVEYEASDNISDIVRYDLEHKYAFSTAQNVVGGGGRKAQRAILVYPNGLQMGPNKFQIPGLGLQMPWQSLSYKDVDHCVFQQVDPETKEQRFKVLPANKKTWDEYLTPTDLYKQQSEWRLCTVISDKDLAISRIDIAHPNAVALDTFICEQIGKKPGSLRYANELQFYEIMGVPRAARKLSRFATVAAVGFPIFNEAIDRLEGRGNLPATAAAMLIGGILTTGLRRFSRGTQPNYDTITYVADAPGETPLEETD